MCGALRGLSRGSALSQANLAGSESPDWSYTDAVGRLLLSGAHGGTLQLLVARGSALTDWIAIQLTSGSTARECRRRVPTTNARRPRSPRPAGDASPRRSRAVISDAVGTFDTPARKMRSNSR